MRNEPGYDAWKTADPRDSEPEEPEFCTYPECRCPLDMGPDNLCLRGLPREGEE
jgi:hypothetical protein